MPHLYPNISELITKDSTSEVPSADMGPLPGTFDLRSTSKGWSQDQDKKDVVSNGTTSKTKNKTLNKKTKTLNNTPVSLTALVNPDKDLSELISDSGNTGKIQRKQQIPLSQGSHYIVQACVSGFVPVRKRLQEINDMAYVVDVTWSDGRTHMVKRTFSDFYNFHFYLLDEWGTRDGKDGPLRLTFYLPGW